MVFCSKPSKGCTNCRVRRIKCDQLDPACSQCLRAAKECPGYRDELSLLFRDESDKVVRKAQVPKQPRPRAQKKANVGVENISNVEVNSGSGSSLNPFFLSSIFTWNAPLSTRRFDDEGIKFFFTHYASIITQYASDKLYFESSPLWSYLLVDKVFANVVSSVGFAGLSNVTKDPKHMVVARRKYAASLHDVTKALREISNSNLDVIFRSVILLATFEVVSGPGPLHGSGSWGVHLDGGAAILKMISVRGSAPASKLQIIFIFSLCVKCLSKGEAAPASMKEWVQRAAQSMNPSDAHSASLIDIIYRFTNLHSQIRNNHPFYDPNLIVQESLALDLELDEWDKQLPETWRFTVKNTTQNSEYLYNGQVHEYQDMWKLRIYHNYRWARIIVNEIIIIYQAQSGSFSSENLLQKQRSLNIIKKLATDICTSVSHMFNRVSVWEAKRKEIPPISGCFMIIFPLAVAGSGIGVPEHLHLWTIKILEVIGNKMGILQALTVVPLIRMQRQRWIEGYGGSGYQVLSQGDLSPRSDTSPVTNPWDSLGRGSFGLSSKDTEFSASSDKIN